jgi:hypothetical protein
VHRKQPSDEWTFLRPDEWLDDNAQAWTEPLTERGPEELAMHETSLSDRAVYDPGRADVDTTMTVPVVDEPVTYFDDEEPEVAVTTAPLDTDPDADEEPDLEEILESQHYAFEDDDS